MLKELFGSRSTEQIFLNLSYSGELHLSAISKNSGIGATALLRKLNELESICILVSRQFGRTRLYSFNPKNKTDRQIKELVKDIYRAMSNEDKEKAFRYTNKK